MTALLVSSLLGYWATDHKLFNVQLIREGEPFQFERAGKPIKTVDEYLNRVLYVSDGKLASVRGVSFKADPRGSDKPTDVSDSTLTLEQWNEQGGLWEVGFEEYLHAHPRLFGNTPLPWPHFPLERIERGGVRAFWDQDLYSGSNPADGLALGAGIDEFTQANFLAWNRFTPPSKFHIPYVITNPSALLWETDILYFTTVPAKTGEGYGHLQWGNC